MPLLWAATQTNLGNALLALGEREEGTERLERAVSVYEQALLERTRELGPLDWAVTQYNLSNALLALGERDGSTERLERAVQVSRSALEVFRAEGATYYEQAARGNLARAEALVAERRAASSVD